MFIHYYYNVPWMMVVVLVINQDVQKAEPQETVGPQESGDAQHNLPPPYSASYGATGEGPPGYEQDQTNAPVVVDTSGTFIFIAF